MRVPIQLGGRKMGKGDTSFVVARVYSYKALRSSQILAKDVTLKRLNRKTQKRK